MENNLVVIEQSQLSAIIREAVKHEVETTVTEILKEQNKAFWTAKDVAEKLQISTRAVRKYTKNGIIPCYTIVSDKARSIRYKPEEVVAAYTKVAYS